jgi:hypothetical protein
LGQFVHKTASEKENLYYGFSINRDEIFCCEGYENAKALLAHLGNVAPVLEEMLNVADVIRVEVHGPARELERLKATNGPSESRVVHARSERVALSANH